MTQETGKLIGIAIREKSRSPMLETEQAEITTAAGIVGDFRGKPGARQVTLLSSEDWSSSCEAVGQPLPWTVRRANLLVEGIRLFLTTDSIIRIGEISLQVTSETDPCSRMDEALPGLRDALAPNWRGGVCCRVLTGGTVKRGASVTLEESSNRQGAVNDALVP